jgi:hypothetical protein
LGSKEIVVSDRYAARTDVPADRSRGEIERLLFRYGATAFQYGWEGDTAAIGFKLADRYVRILLPMPDRADPAFRQSEGGRRRSAETQQRAYEQAVRQRWRALVLIIKAKLEAIASGITTLEREFLADVVMPNNETVGQWLQPQIEAAYQSGRMPPLLPGATE